LVPQMSKRFPAVYYAASAQLTILFTEMCDMGDAYRTWQHTLIARFASYQRIFLDSLLVEYALHNVQTIGDRVFVVAGVDEESEVVHHTPRAILFAAALHRLSNPAFAHFPARSPALVKAFGPQQAASQFPDVSGAKEFVGCVKMPQYRVGIHVGECTAAVNPISGSPHFDVYGPPPGVALAVMQRCRPGHILISSAAKDAADAHVGFDGLGLITRPGVPVTAHGKRRVGTFVISRIGSALPHRPMRELGIRPSVRTIDCTQDDRSDAVPSSHTPSVSTGETPSMA
jgi:class 3 adenylate cyclase